MGFRELQRKKNKKFLIRDQDTEIPVHNLWTIFIFPEFVHRRALPAAAQEQNREREKMKVNNNSYILGQSICRLFYFLAQFLFITNKTELGYDLQMM